MATGEVKIPKKFATICEQIRNGKPEGLDNLNAYNGLEHQKTVIYAELAYFNGEFEKALNYDITICPFWGEWHYSNIRKEHVSAMAFAARLLKRNEEIIKLFTEQSLLIENSVDIPDHIKKANKTYYEIQIERIKNPNTTDEETYKAPEECLSLNELAVEVAQKNKKLDIKSDEGQFALFKRCCSKGSLDDMLMLYEKVAENNLSTMWHIKALSGYNHNKDNKKALEVVLRMARQRLWFVAAHTQVRPMEFFTHPSTFEFLSDKTALDKITQAACRL